MSEDLFLKIIDREIPADIVLETDDVLAFRDVNPQAPVHVLIIPKTHIRTINDIEEAHADLVGKLFLAAKAGDLAEVATRCMALEAETKRVLNALASVRP